MNRKTKRVLLTAAILAVIVWRVWPAVWVFGGLNLRVPVDFTILPKVLPPSTSPVTTHDGFSHPRFEELRLLAEILFLPRTTSHGHVFHPSPRKDELGIRIAEILREPDALTPWLAVTMCGGFHADYLLEWDTPEGTCQAVLCMGCHEVILYRNGNSLRCWLGREAAKKIEDAEKDAEAGNNG